MSPGTLTRYRVMAYITGVLLIVLVFVAMPMKYVAADDSLVAVVGPLHGWVYLLYLVAAFLVAYRQRWGVVRSGLVLLAGTVPLASFVAERYVTRTVRGQSAAQAQVPAVGTNSPDDPPRRSAAAPRTR